MHFFRDFSSPDAPLPPRSGRAIPVPLVVWTLTLALVASAALAQGGRRREQEKDRRERGREVLSPSSTGGAQGEGQRAGWSIVLEVYSGPDALNQAQAALARTAVDSGRNDVFIRTTERGAAIVAGSYDGYDSPRAQADLQAVRARLVNGRAQYGSAFLAPPPGTTDPGRVPELNLETARQTFGSRAQYTLQIAVYEAQKRDEAKRAAEEAALRLRREGELAFYYHGPQRSMVTVGVFGDTDFDRHLRPRSALLLALRERYPLNLLNGQFPIVEKRPGEPDTQQPSMLVRIP
jgi:hypothetical protein